MKTRTILALPIGCILALLWANTLPESYYRAAHLLAFPVNEIGIMFFLGIATKEVVEATLPHGDLHPWRRAALPIASALGGIVVPLIIYVAVLRQVDEPMLMYAWIVPVAVDVAACYVVGGVIFKRHPALPFLLLVALATDAIGLALLGTIHRASPRMLLSGLAIVMVGVGVAIALRRGRIKSFWPYLIVPGALCWWGLLVGGMPPALALVPVVPFMPHARRDAGIFIDAVPKAQDALSRFERWSILPVQAVLF